MLTPNNCIPYIRIRPAKCKIDASQPPGRENNYNSFDDGGDPEFIEELYLVEECNSIDEHISDYEDDSPDSTQFSPDFDQDYADSSGNLSSVPDEDCYENTAELDAELDEGYSDDTAELDADLDDDYYDDNADSGREIDHANSDGSEYDHINDDCTEEPFNLLNLIPTLYWNYPYIRSGYSVYKHNNYFG